MQKELVSNVEYLTPEQAAKLMQVSMKTFYGYIEEKGLPAIRLNRRFFIEKNQFINWLEGYAVNGR
jgi:excisionase family DNA binding protein